MKPMPEPLLTVPQLAELLAVRERFVYEHLDEIPHVRVGRYVRFEPPAIEQYISRRRRGPRSNGDES